jgi:hypothetical protein
MLLLGQYGWHGHVVGASRSEQRGDVFDNRCERDRKTRHSFGQAMRERWQYSHHSAGVFMEISPPKMLRPYETQEMAFSKRPCCFDQIENETGPPFQVGVEDSHSRVEPNSEGGQMSFRLDEPIQIVQHSVERVGGMSRRSRIDGRTTAFETRPVVRYPDGITGHKVNIDARPR